MISMQYPWLLLLLPLPLLVWYFFKPAQPQLGALKVPFFTRISQLFSSASDNQTQSTLQWWLFFIVWSILVIASSNPVWLGDPIAIKRSGRAILLAVDLSGSMKEPDMTWYGQPIRRVDMVKKVGVDFIDKRVGDRIGLILFGSNAYLQAPLTFDRATVKEMLADATLGLAGNYTAIGDAIGLAVKSLDAATDKEKVLVLLTDGANNTGHVTPEEVTQIAARKHIKIYTIGLGANQIQQNSILGQIVVNPSQDLDEATLQKIAEVTGGMFFRATSTEDLQKVYSELNKLEPVSSKNAYLQPKTPFYPWLLGLACILAALIFLSRYQAQFTLKQEG